MNTICQFCHSTFHPRTNQKTCNSPSCKLKLRQANNRRAKDKKKAARPTFYKQCRACGVNFITRRNDHTICGAPECHRAKRAEEAQLRREKNNATLTLPNLANLPIWTNSPRF